MSPRLRDATLRVFVPVDADPVVLGRLEELGARVETCPRDGEPGDPTYRALLAALDAGAVPFTCQGNLNGLAVEGGETLGWEIVSSGCPSTALVVQVGGGALASACIHAFREGVALGAVAAMPRIDTVQTAAAWPLRRAFDEMTQGDHEQASASPRTTAPRSCGRGRTSREASRTGSSTTRPTTGSPWSRGCSPPAADRSSSTRTTLVRANTLAREATGIAVDPTGSAGLAGLLALRAEGRDRARASASQSCSPESCERLRPRGGNEMRSFLGRDILSLKDFERADFQRIFEICDELAPIAKSRQNADMLSGKTLLTAFYQPSTRTRLATEAAMHRLGGHVLGFSDAKMTRAGDFYQESIKDTVHMLEYYGDVIAMRHFEQGAPAEAAKWASIPIINCGDGWGEHPTQVLTDLYTTQKEMGSIDGRTFLLVGDMRMRTMHSILYALSQFDAKAYVVGPPEMSLLPEFTLELDDRNVNYEVAESVEDCISECDVVYMEPVVQPDYTKSRDEEGGGEFAQTPDAYRVTRQLLREKAPHRAIVLHSLPRMDELPADVDATRHARYWQEAFNGVVMRMALLALVLGATE